MARPERKGRGRPSRGRRNMDPEAKSRGNTFEEHQKNGGSRRGGFRGRRDSGRKSRSDFEFTKVTCASCGVECEVPFKPKTSKPVFCSECYEKEEGSDKRGKSSDPTGDLEVIKQKLNKIMKALKIE